MAVHQSKANMGKSTHGSKPSSALSKHQYITKPEVRHKSLESGKASGYPSTFMGANGNVRGFPGGGKATGLDKARYGSTRNK